MREVPKHTVWTSNPYYVDEEEWFSDLREYYPEATEDELYRMMWDTIYDYLDDERANLSIYVPEGIIAIGNLGFWNGRATGYKEVGNRISDCLYDDCDYATWYVDELGDLAGEGIHHDGTNHYIYRAWKSSTTDAQKDALLDKIYMNKATRRDITRYTRSLGKDVAAVYGWTIRGYKPKASA